MSVSRNKPLRILSLAILSALLISCTAKEEAESPEAYEAQTAEAETSYDWGTLAPEEYDAADYTYSFSPYRITASGNAALSETGYAGYCALVDAVMCYADSVNIYSSDADAIVQTLYECYPQIRLVYSLEFSYREGFGPKAQPVVTDEAGNEETSALPEKPEGPDGTLKILYSCDEASHMAALEEFSRKCAAILCKLNIGEYTDEAKALLLYSWTANNVDDMTGKRVFAYDSIVGNGVVAGEDCYIAGGSQSAVFTYLLLQAGIDCTPVYGSIGNSARMWTAVKLKDNWYHCDPSLECTDTAGRGLSFFGMSDEELSGMGYGADYSAASDTTGFVNYLSPDIAPEKRGSLELSCPKQSYSLLRNCDNAKFAADTVTIYQRGSADGSVFMLEKN